MILLKSILSGLLTLGAATLLVVAALLYFTREFGGIIIPLIPGGLILLAMALATFYLGFSWAYKRLRRNLTTHN